MGRVPAGATSIPSVCLLHDYRESQQFSMKLYADRLGAALAGIGVDAEHVRPKELLPQPLRNAWLFDKIDSYVGRFSHYPELAAAIEADVYHIVDHAQAFLIRALDPNRTVVTCHDLMLLVLASGRLGRADVSAVALEVFRHSVRMIERAAAVVAVSEQTKRDLVNLLDIDPLKIDVIAPGMNQPFVADPELRSLGHRRFHLTNRPTVLQVGNSFYKNVEGCLRVVKLLRDRGLTVTFLRGGRRLTAAQQMLAERLGVLDLIREVGPLRDEELPMLYNSADVLLAPSLYEGFGWPPLEAMACAVPVVCSRAGSLGDVAAPAALTADPEDVDTLADHVAAALTDQALADGLRRRGLAWVARFNWTNTAEQMLAVYQRVQRAAGN